MLYLTSKLLSRLHSVVPCIEIDGVSQKDQKRNINKHSQCIQCLYNQAGITSLVHQQGNLANFKGTWVKRPSLQFMKQIMCDLQKGRENSTINIYSKRNHFWIYVK